jgi:pimeloyl-ACP methyl ester carboxylesterase
MNVDLIDFDSADGVELNGMIYGNNKDKIVISVNGMSSNCFRKRERKIAEKVEKIGFDFFFFNNRGSELVKYAISKTEKGKAKFLAGTSYENPEDGLFDIVGAMRKVLELGYKNIILEGHSLGCTKIVYTYNKLKEVKENKISISEISTEEASKLLESIKGIILNSLVDVPRALKIYQGDKFEEYLNYANAKEEEGRVFDIMPPKSFIHPVSIQTYLKYAKYNENIDFAKYHNDLYEFEELNNIEIPLFMRWGNTNEMIEQSAEKLVKMMNEKIKNPNKDINYIDGADHGYYNRENELAEQIAEFLEKYC